MRNIVWLTTGSANSTVGMKMLRALGWNLGDADEQYAESVSVRRLNIACLNGHGFNETAAALAIKAMPEPWAVKDPRFSQTLDRWRDVLAPYRPLLLWVTKDIGYVGASMKRRFGTSPAWAGQRHDKCQRLFDAWPYAKLTLDVAQISAAVSLWDVARTFAAKS